MHKVISFLCAITFSSFAVCASNLPETPILTVYHVNSALASYIESNTKGILTAKVDEIKGASMEEPSKAALFLHISASFNATAEEIKAIIANEPKENSFVGVIEDTIKQFPTVQKGTLIKKELIKVNLTYKNKTWIIENIESGME